MLKNLADGFYLSRLCLCAAFALASVSAAHAGGAVWNFQGVFKNAKGKRMSGVYLVDFQLSDCSGHPNRTWRISKYLRGEWGRFQTRVGAGEFFDEDSSIPQDCKIKIRAPEGAPYRPASVRIQKEPAQGPRDAGKAIDLARMRDDILRDSQKEPLRDSLKDFTAPDVRRKADERHKRLKQVIAREARRLDRRLERARKH